MFVCEFLFRFVLSLLAVLDAKAGELVRELHLPCAVRCHLRKMLSAAHIHTHHPPTPVFDFKSYSLFTSLCTTVKCMQGLLLGDVFFFFIRCSVPRCCSKI